MRTATSRARFQFAGVKLCDFVVGGAGQTRQHVLEIGVGFDAVQAAVLDQGVHHRAALAGFGGSKEEPVLLAQGGGTNGVLD